MDDPWEKLLETAKKVHLGNSKLQDFCPFPKDIKKQKIGGVILFKYNIFQLYLL